MASTTVQTDQAKREIRLGNYILTARIGQGGIAEIFKAKQESLDRVVAIKILSSRLTDDPDIVKRFERESITIARLNHPNIVHVIDKGCVGGRYFFAMEYIDGTTLREVISSDRIPLKTKLDMIVHVLKALDYAHKNGVIHRDVKPSNILIDRHGNARVVDFGIAQIVGTPETDRTASDVVMGTVSYMSPEQKISTASVDQTTDIYAVGVILYEILLGRKPLGHFKLPSQVDPEVDSRFDVVIQKCLASDPADRFQTAVELKDAILEITSSEDDKSEQDKITMKATGSLMGNCRYLDTIKENQYGSTILVERKQDRKLFVIKKNNKGETGRAEAEILRSLRHDNIIGIYGAGGDRRSTIVVSEYAQGGSLADRMVRPHQWQDALEIAVGMARGLDCAHKNQVIHGNLRPSNVLFDANEVVKLADFGTPIHYEGPRKKNWYSPPERKKSVLGDVYGLGVILHQLLTGRNPGYDTGNNLIIEDFRNQIPEAIGDMLHKLLAIRVAQRYQSCADFISDYDAFQESRRVRTGRKVAPVVVPSGPKETVPAWVYVAVGGAIMVLVIVILVLSGALG